MSVWSEFQEGLKGFWHEFLALACGVGLLETLLNGNDISEVVACTATDIKQIIQRIAEARHPMDCGDWWG